MRDRQVARIGPSHANAHELAVLDENVSDIGRDIAEEVVNVVRLGDATARELRPKPIHYTASIRVNESADQRSGVCVR
jgi:hypothetical protein